MTTNFSGEEIGQPDVEMEHETAADQPLQGIADAELKSDPEKERDNKGKEPQQNVAVGTALQHSEMCRSSKQ